MVFRPSIVGVLLLDLALTVAGQQAVWGQCGGIGWTGATNCVSGACCQYQNDWYSQCLPGDCSPGGGQPTTTSSPGNPTTTSSNPGGPTSTNVSSGCGSSSGMNSGTKSITVNGKQRQYILTLPQNYNSNTPYKLFFGLHWLSGTMQDVVGGNYYGVQPLSNNGAIFVAPQGLNNGWANSGGEDITLMDDILSTLQSGLCIDNNHIYSMGWSYGGAMSYALACARPNVFRGVAALSGANLSGCSPGTQPVAYYGQHGVSDDVLNISMGRSIRDTFVRNNGCNSANPQEPSAGSGTHIKTVYTGCSSGHPVWWTAFDGGHDPLPKDRNSGTSWTSGELWNFFSQLD